MGGVKGRLQVQRQHRKEVWVDPKCFRMGEDRDKDDPSLTILAAIKKEDDQLRKHQELPRFKV